MIKLTFLIFFLFYSFWSMEFFSLFLWIIWLSTFFFIDSTSLFLIIMTIFLMNMFLMNFKMNKIISILIFASTINLFNSNSMMEIFILFEFSLVPLFFLINSYGESFKRLNASWIMFFYTFLSSIPFIIFIFFYSKSYFTFEINLFKNFNKWVSLMFSIMLMVKTPLFMFHFWLPKAHVESPFYGSMILAGLILKIGGFLFLKFSKMILFSFMSEIIFWISLLGCIYSATNCFLELDQKILIAYSSIAHMSMMMMTFSMFSKMTVFSMLIFMISHAIISSMMFFKMNVLYEKIKTKNFLIFKSIFKNNKKIAMIAFMILSSNFGTPPFLSFFSEFISCFLILEKFKWMFITMFFIMSIMYMYNLNFFFNMSLGNPKKMLKFNIEKKNYNFMTIMTMNLITSYYFFMCLF